MRNFTLILLVCNLPALALIGLTAWFAYLDNGYWGWPFVGALLCMQGIKSKKELYEEEKEIEIQKQKDLKKYGNIFSKAKEN